MASKVYIAVICILLCSDICILHACPSAGSDPPCKALGTTWESGKRHRLIHDNTCFVQDCNYGKWHYHTSECLFEGSCYADWELAVINGTKHRCHIHHVDGIWTKNLRVKEVFDMHDELVGNAKKHFG
ncbi:hypothetical protein PoB_005463200 [Plakobranchus ocellatus]|uniref:Uncharacterized protein n=1 Tax=Plakobranchus ocellatus TaxID=259542 RepID=A0AAV4CA19_9GAST|nr:hypothetical protein PoB_005463200 [Plakobranchus ocellatus]